MLTMDDAIQDSLMPQVNSMMARRNPNGCPVPATWFAQALYSTPYLLSSWYANGNEV